MRSFIYLHGFASSPQSSKAVFFSERLEEHGFHLHAPDLNQPEFRTLTISRMLEQLDRLIESLPAGDVVLIGSSLGGLVAVEGAARRASSTSHPVSLVILLAPAVELEWDRWDEIGRVGLEPWRESGEIDIFHYADDLPRALSYSFYEDARQYHTSSIELRQPVIIFQGRFDDSVSPALVERFAGRQPHCRLYLLEDGHQLKASLSFIWDVMAPLVLSGAPQE